MTPKEKLQQQADRDEGLEPDPDLELDVARELEAMEAEARDA